MKFNLIDEQWIPVKRRDGTEVSIAPWEVTSSINENPVVALNATRSDFNGALIQFLIGLVQTTAAPANRIEWKKKLSTPPSPDELKAHFAPVRYAFELGGDGPRFMQDLDRTGGEEWEISSLLIDSPGKNTLQNNQDHFVKRGRADVMCPSCCATALYTLQINAPYGGVGHQSSIRGGGPLTTLVLSQRNDNDILWETIWLNTLENNSFLNSCGDLNKIEDKDKFLWLTTTRTSEKNGGRDTTAQHVHPAHIFWSMSRRIILGTEYSKPSTCDICGNSTGQGIKVYRAHTFGTKYRGSWLHPHSPHKRLNNELISIQAQPGGITYRHWLGLVQEDSTLSIEPALVVHRLRENPPEPDSVYRLWAFGYDTDPQRPTKVRCWYEGKMPLVYVNSSVRKEYEQCIANLIIAAKEVIKNTRSAVKKAWFKRPGDVKGETSFVFSVFWHHTEQDFYETLNSVKLSLESGKDLFGILKMWHNYICNEALQLFDSYAWNGPVEDADPKRTVIARKELAIYNHGKKIKELIGLPVEKKSFPKKKK